MCCSLISGPRFILTSSKCDHGISPGCAVCGDVAGEQRDQCENDRDKEKGRKVDCACLIKSGAKERGGKKCYDQSDEGTGSNQEAGTRQDEAKDVVSLRAESHADADLMRALRDEKRHHSIDSNRREHQREPGKDSQKDDR